MFDYTVVMLTRLSMCIQMAYIGIFESMQLDETDICHHVNVFPPMFHIMELMFPRTVITN